MSNLQVKDAAGVSKYMKADGAGSDVDPHIGHHVVDSIGSPLPAGTNIIGATKDAGVAQTVTRTFTQNDNIATAAVAITAAPDAGKKIVATDILVSVDTACYLTIQEETSGTVFAGLYMPANGSAQITLRGFIKA